MYIIHNHGNTSHFQHQRARSPACQRCATPLVGKTCQMQWQSAVVPTIITRWKVSAVAFLLLMTLSWLKTRHNSALTWLSDHSSSTDTGDTNHDPLTLISVITLINKILPLHITCINTINNLLRPKGQLKIKKKLFYSNSLNVKVHYKRCGPGHEWWFMASFQNGDYNKWQKKMSQTSCFALKQSPFFFKHP